MSSSPKRGWPRWITGPTVSFQGIRPVRSAQSTAAAPPTSCSDGTVA
jgi:hypothetical protein